MAFSCLNYIHTYLIFFKLSQLDCIPILWSLKVEMNYLINSEQGTKKQIITFIKFVPFICKSLNDFQLVFTMWKLWEGDHHHNEASFFKKHRRTMQNKDFFWMDENFSIIELKNISTHKLIIVNLHCIFNQLSTNPIITQYIK